LNDFREGHQKFDIRRIPPTFYFLCILNREMTERDKLGDCDSWQESNFARLLFETQLQAEWQLPY
jgi:hypothetical protein